MSTPVRARPSMLMVVGSVIGAAGIALFLYLLIAGLVAFAIGAIILLVVGAAIVRAARRGPREKALTR